VAEHHIITALAVRRGVTWKAGALRYGVPVRKAVSMQYIGLIILAALAIFFVVAKRGGG